MDKSFSKPVNLDAARSVTSTETGRDVHRLSDEALALRLQAGDQSALDEIVHRYQGRLFAVAYRVTGSREDALDVTQDVFLKAYRRISDWKPTGKFGAWLMRLTVNQSIDATRKRRRQPATLSIDVETTPTPASTADASRGARSAEIDARVQVALQALSPMQRTVFVLRHYEGHALADIAPIVGCTVGSVKVHLFRAMKKMRAELNDLRE